MLVEVAQRVITSWQKLDGSAGVVARHLLPVQYLITFCNHRTVAFWSADVRNLSKRLGIPY